MSALCGPEDLLPHIMAVSMLVQPDFFQKQPLGTKGGCTPMQDATTQARCSPFVQLSKLLRITLYGKRGQSPCTCPASGSHIRRQGDIKVYFGSYQVRDSKSSSNHLGYQAKYPNNQIPKYHKHHKLRGALTWVLVNKLIDLLLPEVKNHLTNYLNEGWGSWCFQPGEEKAAGRN